MSRDEMHAEPDGEGSSYNNVHRAFLQAFLSRPVMTIDEIKPVLAAIMTAHDPNRPTLEGDITTPLLTSTLQTINTRLQPLDYQIRSTRNQVSKTPTYALVNSTSDPLTHLATTFSIDQIAYIKRLLDAIFETNNTPSREIMAVTFTEAGQLARAPRRATARQSQVNGDASMLDADAEGETQGMSTPAIKGLDLDESHTVIDTLIQQSFFTKSRLAGKDYYSLAPRALMELRSYLKETYNEPADPEDADDEPVVRIRDCEGCREIVTVGVRCRKRVCGVRFHEGCAEGYFGGRRGEGRVCPTCKEAWTGDVFVGPRAAEGGRVS